MLYFYSSFFQKMLEDSFSQFESPTRTCIIKPFVLWGAWDNKKIIDGIRALIRHRRQAPADIDKWEKYAILVPSLGKGKHGFDGRKCAHTSSSPLTIRQYSLRVFSRLNTFPLRQNCFAPDSDIFSSDFYFLRCRRAGARQGEKCKKRRKGVLSGVSALIKRWYQQIIKY